MRKFLLLMAMTLVAVNSHSRGEEPRLKILDKEPRLILLAGGPQLTKAGEAKRFIDLVHRHYDNKCPHTIEVLEKEGKTTKSVKGMAEAVLPALAKAKEKKLPIVVLAHLPPLVTKPAADVLIRNEKDQERIKAYGDLFAAYAQTLRKGGADLVVLGMEGAVGPDKTDPDSTGAYAHLWRVSDEVAGRSLPGVAVGPRLFQTFDTNRHLYMGKDHHITPKGFRVVSQLWYQSLCQIDGIPIPEWSTKELAELLKK